MLDEEQTDTPTTPAAGSPAGGSTKEAPKKRGRASRPSGPPAAAAEASTASAAPQPHSEVETKDAVVDPEGDPKPARRRRTTKKVAATTAEPAAGAADPSAPSVEPTETVSDTASAPIAAPKPAVAIVFQAPEPVKLAPARSRKAVEPDPADREFASAEDASLSADADADPSPADDEESSADGASRNSRRRRGRRGRGRGTTGVDGETEGKSAGLSADETDAAESSGVNDDGDERAQSADGADDASAEDGESASTSTRRRRRRRRTSSGSVDGEETEDPPNTVTHVREPRPQRQSRDGEPADGEGVRGVKGSTRLEAKRQRRRDGRETGRRRPQVLTEAEFLARRESVERVMVVRQGDDRTQIAVLEDGVLVEHYVARKDASSIVGNVYLGKVQNVLPSMEAAFVDIGRGRNAVLYAGEVNYDASMLEGKPARIEQALKSGQSVLVQVTKDPIGHKGSRLTSQVSVPGRFMVYVPDGRVSGISRKLPDTERNRLKNILKRLMPEEAGVIIRTAAEGSTEADLERDLSRLIAQWEDIEKKAKTATAPSLIYGEPDLVIRVIRDIFNEDFASVVVQGADEWETVSNYVSWVAPDLAERAKRWDEDGDIFAAYRVDEQIAKALDRKVWLPSGGYLIIDRTEAMIVVDVNTGKFTGKGGNLEQTVTKNNLEAAEEIVRQLRLRDLGGIIVIDFIDMVLESNRDLVLRRLTECLGRDRTRHQVAEVTSLGLVQMTRKRVGQGLIEAFSHVCKECGGSGIIVDHDPVAHERPVRPPKPTPPKSPPKAERSADAVAESPAATDEVSPEPDAAEPAATDDVSPEPDAAEPAATDDVSPEPDAAEPRTSEPVGV